MSSLRSILVIGATGQQGGALIRALTSKSQQQFEIYALTRNKASSGAQRLAQHASVKVIEGSLDHPDAIFRQINSPLWGLFAVTVLEKGHVKEELQGRALIEAADKAKVSHIVFTATDRGGQTKSEDNPTDVPHFFSKYNVEQLIKEKSARSNGRLTYTFLRPVAFYENFQDSFFGRAHMTMWRMDGDEAKLQMIATRDIGKIAAEAFLHPDGPRYKNNAVTLGAEALSAAEVRKIFKEETGKEYVQTYWLVGAAVRYLVKDLRLMYRFFTAGGFDADIPALQKEYPFLTDFRTWLREESAWKKS